MRLLALGKKGGEAGQAGGGVVRVALPIRCGVVCIA